MACPCCGCETDEDCPITCQQVGDLEDPEGNLPDGWEFNGVAGTKNNTVESCDDCNESTYPAPENVIDYGLNCFQAPCCDNECYTEDEVCPP